MNDRVNLLRKILIVLLALIAIGAGLFNVMNFFDIAVTTDTLKIRLGFLGFGVLCGGIALVLSQLE